MNLAHQARALVAYRLSKKSTGGKELAARLKVENAAAAHALAEQGRQIHLAESYRLTEREWEAMKVIARTEARRIELHPSCSIKASQVDWAAGKRRGWCAYVISRRLVERPNEGVGPEGAGPDRTYLGLVWHSRNGHMGLTPAGWAFVWSTGLIKPNWKVPA
jgi:hypothetical protein